MSFQLADVDNIYQHFIQLKKADVSLISEWIKNQPHLPELEELQIILFLQSCSYEIDFTKITIENYFKFRTSASLCTKLESNAVKNVLTSFYIGFFPKKTPEGYSVMLLRILDPRPEIYNCVEHSKVIVGLITLYFHQFGPSNGLIAIFDMKFASFGHLFRFSVSPIKQIVYFAQEAAPTQVKQLHFINANSFTQRFISFLKPFMKSNLYNLIKVHSNSFDNFYECVPKECLPEDYGGLLPSIKELAEKNMTNCFNQWKFFEWHETQKINEPESK